MNPAMYDTVAISTSRDVANSLASTNLLLGIGSVSSISRVLSSFSTAIVIEATPKAVDITIIGAKRNKNWENVSDESIEGLITLPLKSTNSLALIGSDMNLGLYI